MTSASVAEVVTGLPMQHDHEFLPPPEVRLLDPFKDGKIPTHTDDRGLVDVARVIEDVRATIDPSYEWPPGLSVHHFYWPESVYPARPVGTTYNLSTFRNLPIHKGLVLRSFENWLHLVTEPPPLPEPEVIDYRVEAWSVARDLFRTARTTVQWERRARRRRELIAANPGVVPADFDGADIIGEEIMHEVLEKYFRGFQRHAERHQAIPQEHQIVDLSKSPREVAAALGKLVGPPSLRLVRAITE